MDRNITQVCSDRLLDYFGMSTDRKMWRVNVLMLINGILMGVVVGIGAYAPRYRRHVLIRFLFLGASTLFLPIVSSVAATLGSDQYFSGSLFGRHVVVAKCQPGIHIVLVLVWTGLVVLVGINTSAVVAGDEREGRNVGPPTELLIKAGWTTYLIYITTSKRGFLATTRYLGKLLQSGSFGHQVQIMFALLTCLTFCKLLFKYITFHRAKRSVALGRSPRFIAGYMAELRESQSIAPALVVQGEETGQVEKWLHGDSTRRNKVDSTSREVPDQGDSTRRECPQLVTLDRVWGHSLLWSEPKDLCFSFALFKLLRCRFAKYTVFEAGFMKAREFFRDTLLKGHDYERVFQVVADELSFLHDYYYSAQPSNFLLSLFSIGYCSYMFVFVSQAMMHLGGYEQIYCLVWCPYSKITRHQSGDRSLYSVGTGTNKRGTYLDFGNTYYDVVPVYLVLTVLMFSEIRDIVSHIGSKWTKVALVCKYVNSNSAVLEKRIAFAFRCCKIKLVRSWEGKMNQCSILVLRPWDISLLPRSLLRLPNQKKVKVPGEVKAAVFKALKNLTSDQEGAIKHIRPPSSPVSGPTAVDARSACHGKGAADTILAWHIATSIYELRHPQASNPEGHKIAATHLSRYCAYLVSYRPGLLPDDDEWCKELYKDVKKDADRVLGRRAAASTPEIEYRQLVDLLSADSNHEVLKNGARLGERLVVDSETKWEALANFWVEMILYVAPSENLEGHAEAIAGGGELITLLCTLLPHAGIVGRLDDTAADNSAAVDHA
ncbi:uncharacterized protein LOC133893011 [Phragmites australis]|uniref:uncharacterized protein LOC133893011 n=1 Tax=Phragmites australis TaxID=29695 RepID=UPI002D76CA65|nr:uncharacterized protein LOC133893011 [Phragmites australis]XP_062189975.1 uncharacterized protein LOC133893011 [Phragmites australis]